MKKNIITENNASIDLICPEFPMRYGYTCNDCRYMSRTDSNRYGEYFCGYFRKYMDPGSNVCSHRDIRY